MEKIVDEWKNMNRTNQIVNQTLQPKPKDERMQVRWMIDIPLKRMLKRMC
jgi:hypothetical protein